MISLLVICTTVVVGQLQPIQYSALTTLIDSIGCPSSICPRFNASGRCLGDYLTCSGPNVTLIKSLTGSLPSEIGLLTALEFLYIYRNQLVGTIPTQIGVLSVLTVLSAYENNLTGTIPPLTGLVTLRDLLLNDNILHGTLPPSLSTRTQLDYIELHHNAFTGAVPPLPQPHPLTCRLRDNTSTKERNCFTNGCGTNSYCDCGGQPSPCPTPVMTVSTLAPSSIQSTSSTPLFTTSTQSTTTTPSSPTTMSSPTAMTQSSSDTAAPMSFLPITTTTPPNTTATATTTVIATTRTSAVVSSSTTALPNTSSLKPNVDIAMIVGIVVGGVLILTGCVVGFLYCRLRLRRKSSPSVADSSNIHQVEPAHANQPSHYSQMSMAPSVEDIKNRPPAQLPALTSGYVGYAEGNLDT